jgi:GNAT superfamily N-acetyltransferase
MKDAVTLKRATQSDIPALQNFQQQIIAAERPFDRTLADGPIRYYDLEHMVGSDNVEMLVASCNGALVGCGFARIEAAKPYLRHRREGYLGLMYVAPDHRGRGVNQKIVQALKSWCRERGVTELRLDVYDGNVAAIRAYEKEGFSRHLIEMRMSI